MRRAIHDPAAAAADDDAPAVRTRQPIRQLEVVHALRRRILAGELDAGERMPTRALLMRQFDVSSITLQRAFDDLAELGLVVPRGSHGTFVAERLPHRTRFALLFPNAPAHDGRWSRFYEALEREAARAGGTEATITCWRGQVDGPRPRDQHQLEAALAMQLFAGVVYAYNPAVHGGGLVGAPDVPRAAIAWPAPPGVIPIRHDGESFAQRIVEVLKARRARRVAIIGSSWYPLDALADRLGRDGFETRPQWLLGVDIAHPRLATPLARLLVAPWARERPDAVVVADDNLEEAVVAGVNAEGVRIGVDLAVIAHANFPRVASGGDGVVRVGYDAGELLTTALAALRAARGKRGDRAAKPIDVLARLERDAPTPHLAPSA